MEPDKETKQPVEKEEVPKEQEKVEHKVGG